jgi:hypothetical protein
MLPFMSSAFLTSHLSELARNLILGRRFDQGDVAFVPFYFYFFIDLSKLKLLDLRKCKGNEKKVKINL